MSDSIILTGLPGWRRFHFYQTPGKPFFQGLSQVLFDLPGIAIVFVDERRRELVHPNGFLQFAPDGTRSEIQGVIAAIGNTHEREISADFGRNDVGISRKNLVVLKYGSHFGYWLGLVIVLSRQNANCVSHDLIMPPAGEPTVKYS